MSGDTLTVLRARGRRLAKLVHADGTVDGYDAARTFDLHERPVADLSALADALADLQGRSDRAVVRGGIYCAARTRGVRRLLHLDPKTGDHATLRVQARRWLSLDLDGLPLPAGTDPRDLAACAAAVLPLLPEAVRGADVLVQATGSHGIKPGARLRLWCWLTRPLVDHELGRWFRGVPVDPSGFRSAQVTYTAAPVFGPGATDPLPRRLLRIAGACRAATPPPPEALAEPPRPTSPPPRPSASGGRYAQAALTRAVGNIAQQAEGTRHATAVAEAWGLARLVVAGLLAESEVVRAVEGALCHAGKPRGEGEAIAAWALAHRADAGNAPRGAR